MSVEETWMAAARRFVDLIEELPGDLWEAPALGAWNLRDLVGHTTSSGVNSLIVTLDRPAETEEIASPERYYAFAKSVEPAIYRAAVAASADDARRTGESLGENPAPAVRQVVDRAISRLAATDTDALIQSAAGGMRLRAWLPTRTFELAVHSLDIAAAAGIPAQLPDQVISAAVTLAGHIATAIGKGPSALLALTGRGSLPRDFLVV